MLAVIGAAVFSAVCFPSPAVEGKTVEQIQQEFYQYRSESYDAGRMPADDRIQDLIAMAYEVVDATEESSVAIASLALVMDMAASGSPELHADWREAADRLSAKYVNEPALASTLMGLQYVPPTLHAARAELFDLVEADTENEQVLASLLLTRLNILMEQDMRERLSDEQTSTVEQLMTRLVSEFGEFEDVYGRGTFASMVKAKRYEWENLRVGSKAPNLTGVDGDGEPISLQDYAGKVIFLDFWAHW